MAKSGNSENGNGGLNPGFSVSYDSSTNTFTPSGPTTPSWAPGNTPGAGGTNPAGLNDSENNKDSKNDINLNEAAAKLEAAKKNAEKSNDANAEEYAITHRGYLTYKNNKTPGEIQKELASRPLAKNKESFKKGDPSENNVPVVNNAPADISAPAPADTSAPAPANTSAPATSETAAPSVSESFSDATNTGVTYRGGTVTTPSGTSVTDSGTGGSISSSINLPSRNASSIGLGVYNADRANYDQDNWNRGMESESSSLVSDEECKSFAKRAFMENSEPFKIVKTTIVKKC